ncbi:hypothetical protein ACOMHN_001429 [Nucella lapillus]
MASLLMTVLAITELENDLTSCIQANQAMIDGKFFLCMTTNSGGLTPACYAKKERDCSVQALHDCCPSACQYQDTYIYKFYRSQFASSSQTCSWEESSPVSK